MGKERGELSESDSISRVRRKKLALGYRIPLTPEEFLVTLLVVIIGFSL